jgi:oligoribonuclease NrnB/cAMP/cGMP phosphodiesterase (DHH superfamily)
MVKEKLIDKEEMDFEEYAVQPRKEYVTFDSILEEQRVKEFSRKLDMLPDTVILTHDDADGLTSAAIAFYREKELFDNEAIIETVAHYGPFQLEDALEQMYTHAHVPEKLFILDFEFGEIEDSKIRLLSKVAEGVKCFDHHQWKNPERISKMDDVELTIDEDECAASLLAKEWKIPTRWYVLGQITKDYDLWMRDNSKSKRLNIFAQEVAKDPADYAFTLSRASLNLGKVPGLDIEWLEDAGEEVCRDFGREFSHTRFGAGVRHNAEASLGALKEQEIDKQIEENEMLVDYAVDRVVGDTEGLGIVYAGKGPSAEIGNHIVEEEWEEMQAVAVLKPHGGGSVYSHSNREKFDECHTVAKKLGGGGHPTAAGFSFDFDTFTEMAEYWSTQGENKYEVIIDAFEEVRNADS